ncbi:hypothetical protein HYZ78_02925 [Candidatus Microgenomates bacterium]|nr:hypothetical protein [Candidatus Microgenomates bacterium]
MKLPGISDLIGKRDEQDEILVSFIIGKNWIQAGLWKVVGGKCEVLSTGSTDSWQDTDSFVGAADDSLSSAIGSIEEPPEEIKSVVFGLPSDWLSDGNLKPQYLSSLKSLCDKLELKPSGFVVVPEALTHFLKDREGAPVSTILTGIEEEEMEVMLIRSGKIVNSQAVSRSISLPDDITEGLTRFTADSKEPLPPRIILFNRRKSSLEEATQSLLTFEWPADFFMHAPRVEYLTPEEQILAVSSAAAGELMPKAQATLMPKAQATLMEAVPAGDEVEKVDKIDRVEEKIPAPVEHTTEVENVQAPPASQVQKDEEKLSRVGKILGIFAPLASLGLKFPHIPAGGRSKKLLALLCILALLAGFFWWFLPSAVVNVYLSPRKIEEKITLSIDPTGRDSADVVPGRVISVQISGEKTKGTTGTSTVGDRAKGEITIYNNTSQSKSFSPGVVFTNSTGLKFNLDLPVTIASESGAPTYIPGQSKTVVTAAGIGAEYNLEAGNIFSIANFSTNTFSAKNETALTGGSSREVSAVSKDDQKKLEEELLVELEEEVKNKISGQIAQSEKVIGESAKVDITKKNFSSNVGTEAQTLKLTATGEGRVVVVQKEKLNEKLLSALSGKVPSEFTLSPENITVSFGSVEEDKIGIMKLDANIVGSLLPKIDIKKLASEIRGKSPAKVRERLATLPGFARTTIKLTLTPPLFSNLPQRAEKIVVKILAEQ